MNVHRIRGTRVSNHARVHFRFDEACDATLLINNAIYPGQESGIAAYFSSRSISSQPVRATWMIQMIKKKNVIRILRTPLTHSDYSSWFARNLFRCYCTAMGETEKKRCAISSSREDAARLLERYVIISLIKSRFK